MAAVGIVLGLVGAAAVARAVRSLLVDVPVFDPVTLGGVSAGIALVVILAAVVPARRATRVDPNETLKAG
jgi:ABC-type antimicrobial peptide transport system permease subunit